MLSIKFNNKLMTLNEYIVLLDLVVHVYILTLKLYMANRN